MSRKTFRESPSLIAWLKPRNLESAGNRELSAIEPLLNFLHKIRQPEPGVDILFRPANLFRECFDGIDLGPDAEQRRHDYLIIGIFLFCRVAFVRRGAACRAFEANAFMAGKERVRPRCQGRRVRVHRSAVESLDTRSGGSGAEFGQEGTYDSVIQITKGGRSGHRWRDNVPSDLSL